MVRQPIKREDACKPTMLPNGRMVYRCTYCNKEFCTVSDVNRHMDFHEGLSSGTLFTYFLICYNHLINNCYATVPQIELLGTSSSSTVSCTEKLNFTTAFSRLRARPHETCV